MFNLPSLQNVTSAIPFAGTFNIHALIAAHGYLAIIALMSLESASLPIPSEIVLPVIGYYVYTGTLNIYLAILSTLVGTAIGITADYFIAYFLGKDLVYKHAEKFHIKKESLDHFDKWFNNNISFTVFIGRLLPVVRGLISFPAGFAQMDLKVFYSYSLAGSLIWNVALIEFGYYTLGASSTNLILTIGICGLFLQMLYLFYKTSFNKIKEDNMRKESKKKF